MSCIIFLLLILDSLLMFFESRGPEGALACGIISRHVLHRNLNSCHNVSTETW